MHIGIIFACIALLGWGVGDFLIEKSTRKMGDVSSLFFITAFGSIALLPFVYRDIPPLVEFSNGTKDFWVLLSAGIFALIASLFDFEALRIGKIAIVEPVYALEIIGTLLIAGFAINEWLTGTQTVLVLAVMVGIVLLSVKNFSVLSNIHLERGILYAITAALFMAGENFLTGYGSRITNPLLTNWVINTIITLATLGYLIRVGNVRRLMDYMLRFPALIFWVSLTDTIGWIAFSYSMVHIPIGLATGISESYIALAVLLGLILNKEKLKPHQLGGVAATVLAAIILAYFS